MGLESNIQDVTARLIAIRDRLDTGPNNAVPADFSDAVFSAVNAGMGLMKQRIFNEGLDAEGVSLGKYTGPRSRLTKAKFAGVREDQFDEKERKKQKRAAGKQIKSDPNAMLTEYEKYRLSRGRQIEYKDLELEGALRRAIITAVGGGQVLIVIANEEQGSIARYQEKQIGNIRAGQNANTGNAEPANIFRLSQEEFDHVLKEGTAAVSQVLKKLISDI